MNSLRCRVKGIGSGGEPTLYKHFNLSTKHSWNIRPSVLLTNGTTMNRELVQQLNFHEVQVSLDGMEMGHDTIRGKGNFQKLFAPWNLLREAGIDLSVATMVHKLNLDEWDSMRELVESMEVREWSIDYPCVKGRWGLHPELQAE